MTESHHDIDTTLAREEARTRLRDDAILSWQDYQATGSHVTAEAVDEWLAQLEAGEDAGPPACIP